MPNPFALPLHPMIVHFPIAMLTAAWACLVLRYATGDLRWDDRTRLFELVGVAFLAPTVAAGFVSAEGFGFVLRPRFDQPLIWHMIAGLTAAGVFTAHWAWRRRRPAVQIVGLAAAQDVGLASIGMVALVAAGLIGGEMVYG